jgi:hypothetical protein
MKTGAKKAAQRREYWTRRHWSSSDQASEWRK